MSGMHKNYFITLLMGVLLTGCAQGFKSNTGKEYPFQIQTFLIDQPSSTVLISHGSACLTEQSFDWARQINSWGYNAIVIDHCSARGVYRYTGQFPPENLTAIDKAKDYVVVAEWVRTQSWHSGRVGVVGFSRGGAGVLMFANDEMLESTKSVSKAQLELIDIGIAFYPGCTPHNPPRKPHLPVLVHHGTSDSLAVPYYCNYGSLTDPNYKIVLYQDVHHTFDQQGPDIEGSGAAGRWVARRYNREADIKSRELTKEFLDVYLKSGSNS